MHKSRLGNIVIDCPTNALLQEARFWSAALGCPLPKGMDAPQFKEVRNTMRFLSIVLFLFLSACGQSSTDDTASREQSSDSSLSFKYQCESGKTIKVSYPTDSTAVVKYDNRRLHMKIAVSASGARYVGDGLEWWTKGSWRGYEGTLFRHESGGTTGEIVEQCEQSTDRRVRE